MKAQILTYHFSDNYGALFQAYSLREWFVRRGVDASFINYHPRYVEEGGEVDQLLNPKKWKKNMAIGYLNVMHRYRRIFGNQMQRTAFEEFRKDYLDIKGPRLFESDDLALVVNADLLVCGSDQIWNPSVQKGLDPVYFLDFPGASEARRIAYAPSFGRADLPADYHAEAGRLISQLDAISVREKSGVKIVNAVSGRLGSCVPDPTILLGDFSALLGGDVPMRETHVFCYALRTDQIIRGVAERVANIAGAKLVSPAFARQGWKAIGTGVAPGPVEWLQLLNTATTVVSNSFHGVALSITLNKPFVAVPLIGKRHALNERVHNLLRQTGLENRVVDPAVPSDVDAVMAQSIDWSNVNKKLATMRRHGEQYLDAQIAVVKGIAYG